MTTYETAPTGVEYGRGGHGTDEPTVDHGAYPPGNPPSVTPFLCSERIVLTCDVWWPPCARCGLPPRFVAANQAPPRTLRGGAPCR